MNRRTSTGTIKLAAVGVLLFVNVALVVGILEKNRFFPFDTEPAVVEQATTNGGVSTGETPATEDRSPDLLSTDSTIERPVAQGDGAVVAGADAGADADADFDDWPGGRGPVPPGLPVPREALLDESGLLLLTGSVPSWSVAVELVEAAGAGLLGGIGSVDNQLSWHPDASEDPRSGTVRIDPAVLYPSGSTAVPEEARPGLDVVAEILTANPSVFVVVIAHTDDLGDSDENVAVAFARATGVVDYLRSVGANSEQLVIAADGDGQPTVPNDSDEGRTFNRRVEIQFKNLLTEGSTLGR